MMKTCRITELLDGWYGYPKFPRDRALELAKLVDGEDIEWDDVRQKYLESLESH
jgi:hypothetical protein